jgi:lysozyme
MTDLLLADLRRDEGWREFAYDDRDGEPVSCSGWVTIGHGFLIDARKGVGLPRPVAEFWLRYALNERRDELRKRWPAFDRQPEDVQRALGNMVYQLGPDGVLGFKNMLHALERGDRLEAAAHARDSKWRRSQSPDRAERVCRLMEGRT